MNTSYSGGTGEKTVERKCQRGGATGSGIMFQVVHLVLGLVALFMSFKCNNGFSFGHFLAACCCPYLYLPYILATKGTCGIKIGK